MGPGSLGSYPTELTVVGATLFFVANDGDHDGENKELWRSDGSEGGTVRVADIYPGANPINLRPRELTATPDRLYFSADDGVHGHELWSSDGSEEGTALVADIAADSAAANPYWIFDAGRLLFLVADDHVHGPELWAVPTPIFRDGFESGFTTAWSAAVP